MEEEKNKEAKYYGFLDLRIRPLCPGTQYGRVYTRARQFKKVTHCLFDLDGTILDSESMYHEIVKKVCANHKKKYTEAMEARMRGATDQQVCVFLVKELNLNVTPQQLEREIDDLSKIRLPHSPLQKGVERLLTHFHASGVPFALATNSNRRSVRMHMATKPKIFGMFHHMVCATDPEVDRGKPHPDIYLVAADKFPDKPKPVKCLVFEDSLVGLEAAVAAGMQVVMTPTFRMQPKYARRATIVLKSLLDFKPEYFGLPPFTDQPDCNRKRPKPGY